MTSLVCIFSLLVLVSCLRMQLSHQARGQRRQSTSPAHVKRPRSATAHFGDARPIRQPVRSDIRRDGRRPSSRERLDAAPQGGESGPFSAVGASNSVSRIER
jgi:hypothetical protein